MVLDKWKTELRVKKCKVDISTTPWQNSLHGPIIAPMAETDYSFRSVKGEDYENLVDFFKTYTLKCLINGARRLLIFQSPPSKIIRTPRLSIFKEC